jgi:5'-3' exonuclease
MMKELLDILGIVNVQAEGEAETECYKLSDNDNVIGVFTIDTDIIAYGTKCMIQELNSSTFKYTTQALLEYYLDLNRDSILDFCIMCGTDYNSNIPGIGPVKAYDYIRRYENVENVLLAVKEDHSNFKYEDSRKLFRVKKEKRDIPFCRTPDSIELQKQLSAFFEKHNVSVSGSSIEGMSFCPRVDFCISNDDSTN